MGPHYPAAIDAHPASGHRLCNAGQNGRNALVKVAFKPYRQPIKLHIADHDEIPLFRQECLHSHDLRYK